MVAIAGFWFFALVFLAGAALTAMTRRPVRAGLGLSAAVVGVSGLCILLGKIWLAVGLLCLAGAAGLGLFRYLLNGLRVEWSSLAPDRGTVRVVLALTGAALLVQILFAVTGVRLARAGPEQAAPLQAAPPDPMIWVAFALSVCLMLVAGLAIQALTQTPPTPDPKGRGGSGLPTFGPSGKRR